MTPAPVLRSSTGRSLGPRRRQNVAELVRLQVRRDLSIRQIAERLTAAGAATGKSTVDDWWAGRYVPGTPRLKALARILRVSVARLEEIFLAARSNRHTSPRSA